MLTAGQIQEIQWLSEAEPWCTTYYPRKPDESTEEISTVFEQCGWYLKQEIPPSYPYLPTGLVFKKQ